MKKLALLTALLLFCTPLLAGDTHQDGETHTLTYTILNGSGKHVTGQTVRVTVKSSDTTNYWNFTSGVWGAFAGTDSHSNMIEDADGGFYYKNFTVDSPPLMSGDVVFIVSNDNATYADHQVSSVSFSNLNNLIKIYR